MGGRYKQNQMLEELRARQESMKREKQRWQQERDMVDQQIEAKKRELALMQVK